MYQTYDVIVECDHEDMLLLKNACNCLEVEGGEPLVLR